MSLFHSKNVSKSANSAFSENAPRSGSGLLPAMLLAAAGMLALTPAANAGGSFSFGFSFGSSFRDGCDPCVPSWWSSPSYSSSVVFSSGFNNYDPCGWNSWTPVYRRPVFVSTFVSRPICSPVFDPCFPSFWTGYSHWHRPFCGPVVVVAPVFPVYSCDFVPSYAIPGPCDGFYSTYSSSAYFSRSFVSFGFFFGSNNHWRSNWRRDCVVVRPLPPVGGPVVRPRGFIGQPNNGFVVGQQPVAVGPMPTRIPQQPVVVPSAGKPATFVSGPSPSGPAQPNFGKPAIQPGVVTQPYIATKPPVPTTPTAVNPVIRESTGKPVAWNGNPGVVTGKVPTAPVASKPQVQPQVPSRVEPTKPQAPATNPFTQPAKPQVEPPKQPQTQPQTQPSYQPAKPTMGPTQTKPAPSLSTIAPAPSPASQFRPFVPTKPAAPAPSDSGISKQPSAYQSGYQSGYQSPSQGFTAQPAPSRQMTQPSSPSFVSPQGQLGQRERMSGASPSAAAPQSPAPSQRQAPSVAKPSASPSPSPAPSAAPAPAVRQSSGPSFSGNGGNGGGSPGQGGGFGGGFSGGQGGGFAGQGGGSGNRK